MKNPGSSRYRPVLPIILLVAIVALTTRATRVPSQETGPTTQNNSSNSALLDQDKNRPASATGENLREADPTKNGDEADEQKVIVVGKVISNHCRLSSDGQQVVTDYRVRVIQVQEGSLPDENMITVTIPGGMVLLKQDGTEVGKRNPLAGKAKNAKVQVVVPNDATSDTKIPVELSGVASTKFTPFDPSQVMQNEKVYLLSLVKNPKEKSFRLSAPPNLTDN